MRHEVKIFLNLAFVYGCLCWRPSSCILFFAYSNSYVQLSERKKYHIFRSRNELTSFLKKNAREVSGTSGRKKKPAMAIGMEITPSMMKSLH
jgi:hypothetical protein